MGVESGPSAENTFIRPESFPGNILSRPTSRRPTSKTAHSSTSANANPRLSRSPNSAHKPHRFSRPGTSTSIAKQSASAGRRERHSSHASDLSIPREEVIDSLEATPTVAVLAGAQLPEVNLDSSDEDNDFPGPHDPERARRLYCAACKRLGVTPCSKFMRSIVLGSINISHQGLGPLGIKALAIGLVTSMAVTELHLAGNKLGAEGLKHIADMISSNGMLKILDVSDNQLGREGAEHLAKIIEDSDALVKLYANGNQFDEQAAIVLAAAFKKNTTVRILELSRNEFREQGGVVLGKALGSKKLKHFCIRTGDNETIESINISWNHLRNVGIFGIAEAIKENIAIKALDVSMNGIGRDGAEALGHALKHNRTLRTLKMRACRVNVDGLVLFFTRMNGNETLKHVDFSENPITNEDAIIALRAILLNQSLAIMEVGMDNVCVSSEFFEVRDQIRQTRPEFKVTFGGTLRVKGMPHHLMQEILTPTVGDPLEMLVKFIKDHGLRIMDLFVRFDKDKSCSITHDELRAGMAEVGLSLSEHQMESLLCKLDADGDGEIDFGELIDAYRRCQRRLFKKSGSDSRGGSRPSSRPSSASGRRNKAGDGRATPSRPLSRQNSRPSTPFAVNMSQPLGTNELVLDGEYLKASQAQHRPSIHEVHVQVPLGLLTSRRISQAIEEARDSGRFDNRFEE
ncbi:leucine-rich repeat-containing protein 74a-like [Plakobranchus ocellatus]|uniref:Leucine-rich repeat-containing protein 74a-like n=1 Tax=Plakobranchus ocellatus TaxID=259542 RepID=A0AAV4CG43_9GAST|nr:leucine-rich repeat-containing protein 74a-like [Plakobranchus ocellatus]